MMLAMVWEYCEHQTINHHPQTEPDLYVHSKSTASADNSQRLVESTAQSRSGVIDLTQLRCPMLLLEFKLLLQSLPSGGQLEVLASDREGVEDCCKFALKSGFKCTHSKLAEHYSIRVVN